MKKYVSCSMSEDPKCLYIMPPKQMSDPCSRFFHHHDELWGFIFFITQLATHTDEGAKIAAEALHHGASDEEKEDLKETMERGAGAIKVLRRFRQLIYQTMVCRAVDNYLTYIAELLALIFRTRPETLKSNEMVRFDELLQHSKMEDFIGALAEKRVEKLSYKGIRDMSSYFQERLGLELFDSEDDLKRAVFLIEVRNIIVHNRGIVNRIFKSRVPWFPAELGEYIKLKRDDDHLENDVFANVTFLAKSVCDIDQRAAEKFRLPLPVSLDEFQRNQSDYS